MLFSLLFHFNVLYYCLYTCIFTSIIYICRYAPYHEDSVDMSEHDKPYVIIIQLPHKNEKKKYHSYQRKHVIDPPRDNDYINDADELKMYQLD